MRIESTKRRKKPTRRFPEQEIRELCRDGRVWARKAQVFEPNGPGSHFKIHTDPSTGAKKVMIEVMTLPEGEDLTCQLSTRPVWYIPPPGTVVFVGIPSGEIDHCPEIVGISDSGDADDDIGTDRTLIASEVEVVVKAPTGKLGGVDASEPLVLGNQWKDFAGAIIDAIVAHRHVSGEAGTPTGPPTNATTFTAEKANLASKLSEIMKTK